VATGMSHRKVVKLARGQLLEIRQGQYAVEVFTRCRSDS
jgi:hypothetical protein